MQEWHPSRPLPEKALDDLYYFTEQSDKKTAPLTAKTPDHTYNWYLLLTGDPEPLEIQAPVLTDKRKKNIIVSNYILAADPEGGKESITLLLELAQRGFSLYVFTQSGQLEPLNPKIRDIPYLKSLFAKSHLLHAQAMRSKLAKSKHPKNPISFSDESCFILDHYQTEKIKHAWEDEAGSLFNYQVRVYAPPLVDSKPLRDHVQWDKSHLILDNFHRRITSSKSFDDLFPGVKKITLYTPRGYFLDCLPEDLEELYITSYSGVMNLSRFNKLLHLTLFNFKGSWEGNLSDQLQTLKIQDINLTNKASFPKLSACHQLKKIEIRERRCKDHVSSMWILSSIPKHPLELHFQGDYTNLSTCFSISGTHPSVSLTRFEFEEINDSSGSNRSNVFNEHLHKVTDLSISGARIDDLILNKSLKKIRLKHVTTIPALPDTLEDLTISECELREITFPSHLRKISLIQNTLTVVDVSNTLKLEYLKITDSPLQTIRGFTALSRLHTLIVDCKEIRELTWIRDLPPSVKHLELIHFPRPINKPFNFSSFSHVHLESFTISKYESIYLPVVMPKTLTCLRLEDTRITALDLRDYSQLRYVYLARNPYLESVQLPAGVISFINEDNNAETVIHTPDKLLPALKKDENHIHKEQDDYGQEQLKRLKLITKDSSSKLSTLADIKRASTPQTKHLDNPMDQYTLKRGTHIDPNKILEVRYKIYSMVNGSETPINASTYRKLVCDRVAWSDEPKLAVSTQDLIKPPHSIRDTEYTTEDLNWLKPNERFVKRPLEVKEAGIHRILLDTLTPYDELIDIFLPPQSELLFNPTLNTYVLEWKTKGPQEATVQYRFHETSPSDNKHSLNSKQRQAPTLDKNLHKHLETLFSPETQHRNASEIFLRLKRELLKLDKQNETEKLAFCRKELANYCKAFGSDPLKEKETPGGWEELEEILIEAKGACRYQAMVFVMLCHFLGVEARYIGNDIHAFVELRNAQGIWEPLQLGGHATQLKYTDQPLNLPKPDSTYPPPLPREAVGEGRERGLLRSARNDEGGGHNDEKGRISWKPYFASERKEKKYENLSAMLDDLHSTANPLVTVADATAAQQLYAAMAHHLAENKYKKPVLYIESPSDLHAFWEVCHIPEDEDDTEEAENAPLREIIEKGGTVMINWERFNATEMDSYKTLMDDPPSFKAVTIDTDVRKDVHFIHMITPKTQGSGAFLSRTNRFVIPAFHSVIPARMPGPRPQEAKLSHPCELDPGILAGTTKGSGETTHKIDLYGSSSHWETQLVGTILPSNQGFTFNSGTLTEIAKATSSEPIHVELVDTPKDHRFQAFMTRLSVNHGFIANGRSRALPKQFTVSDAPAPEIKTPTQLNSIPASTWNADGEPKELPQNVFVLNSSRLPHLFQEQALRETDQEGVFDISTEAGWLPAYKTPSPYPLPPLRGGEGVDSKRARRKIQPPNHPNSSHQ